ncbi:ATP-binding protein [Sphingomonas bacterium]|uniref:ATP-binding protein n=1 Tax=Sphingomonas bacterium TaxID=1895847 RepID=UPI0020C70FE8|nr:ATP-binding protein [Sphingomonas bacterium]
MGEAMTCADASPPGRARWSPEAAGARNMVQLVQLRWVAVLGQLATIAIVRFGMDVRLPLIPMLGVSGAVLLLNVISLLLLRRGRATSNAALFFALVLDVLSLTAQLFLSGGVTNPFVSLYLLQVVLGAILLDTWSTIAIVFLASACFALLIGWYRPIELPPTLADHLATLNVAGAWICFALIATLLVLFVTRISRNLRARDAHLADLRQQAAEEDHIVRMGLLASGAAHELGTPLASLAVILGDWRRNAALACDPELLDDVTEMQAEVGRCKAIVTGVLLAAGEARGESPVATTLRRFVDGLVADWRSGHAATRLAFDDGLRRDPPIVADTALKQVIFNVLDNAAEASPDRIGLAVRLVEDDLVVTVRDVGPGFAPDQLASFGKPYVSSKRRLGGGLGLFLVVNVMRKLGGHVDASNGADGGAIVVLTMPLSTLALAGDADGG